ncbi:Rv1355c family protein [Pedobacter glucosidilyticus]|uniref:Rv1355c family protein n=1 Tax=Pedobacter glucosidilyticus TaxID=1122941 RepID=UPI0003FE9B4F|nr:Rv1355c family protein [Pedobacter glucosidilyticus]
MSNTTTSHFLQLNHHLKEIYQPLILKIHQPKDLQIFNDLISQQQVVFFYDEIWSQLQELIKSKNPSIRLTEDVYKKLIDEELGEFSLEQYGVWVYYPWSKKMVHLLDRDAFVEVRTNRNQYKITREERDLLSTKKIGIVGLSVGQSIALTLAMERGCGELRLADFDTLELSNLNRIRSGVSNLGLSKVIVAAREILEIDPFLNVTCFKEGLTEDNLDDFFLKDGKLDLLVDECDGLDMKIIARHKAKALQIPVLMDTSDRGMLDVERFDLEPNRELLHGTLKGINPHTIKELSNEDKIPLILQMLGAENISLRGKASMVEVQQTINTWPQLASSVTLGGAVAADVSRRILLNQFHASGRYYIDLEELIANPKIDKQENASERKNPHNPLFKQDLINLAQQVSFTKTNNAVTIDEHTLKELIHAAAAAPSTGNDQPWKWLYQEGLLYLFHEENRSYSFGDFQKTASFISLGAAFENLYLKALTFNLNTKINFLPIASQEQLVAVIYFEKSEINTNTLAQDLSTYIHQRCTNRNHALQKNRLEEKQLAYLQEITNSIYPINFQYFTEEKDLKLFGKMIGICDRIRLLNPEGHYDFVHREMRWTTADAEQSKDGIDVKTLGLSNSQLAALSMIKDAAVVKTIKELKGGKAFDTLALKTIESASAICLISVPKYSLESFFKGGQAMERFWLAATKIGLAVHPLISPLYLFTRINHGNGKGLDVSSINELTALRKEFEALTGLDKNNAEVFLAKISFAEQIELKSHRLPLEKILFVS